MALMQRVSPQVELDINDIASGTPSYRRRPNIKTGSLNLCLQLTDNLAAVIMFVVMPSPINMMTFFAFCEILVSRTVQLA